MNSDREYLSWKRHGRFFMLFLRAHLQGQTIMTKVPGGVMFTMPDDVMPSGEQPAEQAEDVMESESVELDTDTPLTQEQAVRAWHLLTKPTKIVEQELSFDPDDYPLY